MRSPGIHNIMCLALRSLGIHNNMGCLDIISKSEKKAAIDSCMTMHAELYLYPSRGMNTSKCLKIISINCYTLKITTTATRMVGPGLIQSYTTWLFLGVTRIKPSAQPMAAVIYSTKVL